VKYDYDMVAIGGGTAGLVSAGMSAVLGAKTLLIEAKKLGGDCTWHGCVPSKSLIRAARVAHQMRSAAQLGLTAADPEHDLSRVMARVHSIREQIYQEADAPPNMQKLGVEVRAGVTRFLDPHTIEIHENGRVEKLTSRYIVIATGSVPHMPEVEGAPGRILNNETLFDLDRLPRRLVILGAGPVGIEMAQAFRRLGSDVTVVNRGKGILGHDDVELTSLLLDHLRQEGIRFVFGAEVERIENNQCF
jgi:Pyruvate/2-oxoglutarate dehydrogenase complex, dihydrolipoamide dehydrogenase (E3) component, and related enzymes